MCTASIVPRDRVLPVAEAAGAAQSDTSELPILHSSFIPPWLLDSEMHFCSYTLTRCHSRSCLSCLLLMCVLVFFFLEKQVTD